MKMVIVGAGSSYTPELVHGLLRRHAELPITELCLTDINDARLAVLSGLTRRMIARSGLSIAVSATTERRRALGGAAFVNTLLRVGGMDARINDERIPLKYGLVGQETTGPGGMMKALRTVPVMLEVARDMIEVCPDAWLINYTNPSGIIAEALGRHSRVHYVGLCSGPVGWIRAILEAMEVSWERASVDWLGLNHLGFAVRVWVDGRDVTAGAVEAVADRWGIDAEWLRVLGVIPASYLRYYYHRDRVVEEATQPGRRTRGEQVKDIEAELLRQYGDPELAEKPALLRERGGGGYADVAIAAMLAIYHNKGERQIVQAPNQGALDGLPAEASVEITCVLDGTGPRPLRLGAIPLPIRGLVQAVKAYESLTVQAAVEGDRRVAMQALMSHPLVPSWGVAKPLLDDLIAANRQWLTWA
jgi:6-phospho-beta-glucosidase